MTVVDELIARSNRLGSDPRNTNYAGGNTSAKGTAADPVTGEDVELLWVKGSGGDLGTLRPAGLAVLRLDRLRALVDVYPGRGPGGRDGRGVRLLPARQRGRRAVDRYRDARAGRCAARGPPAPGFRDRAGHRGGRGEADRRVLRRPGGVGAVAAAGLPARPGHRGHRRGQPAGDRGGAGRARHHRVGADQRGVRGPVAGDHPDRGGVHRGATAGRSRSARSSPATSRCPRPNGWPAPPNWPRSSAAWPAPTGRRSATTPTPRWCSTSSPGPSTRGWPRWARRARTTSCGPRCGRWSWTCRPEPRWRTW